MELEALEAIERLSRLNWIAPRLPYVVSSKYAAQLRAKGYPLSQGEIPPIVEKRDLSEYRQAYPVTRGDTRHAAYDYEIRHLSKEAKEHLES